MTNHETSAKIFQVMPNLTDPKMVNPKHSNKPSVILKEMGEDPDDMAANVFNQPTKTKEEEVAESSGTNSMLIIVFAVIVIALVILIVWLVMRQSPTKEEEEVKAKLMSNRNNLAAAQMHAGQNTAVPNNMQSSDMRQNDVQHVQQLHQSQQANNADQANQADNVEVADQADNTETADLMPKLVPYDQATCDQEDNQNEAELFPMGAAAEASVLANTDASVLANTDASVLANTDASVKAKRTTKKPKKEKPLSIFTEQPALPEEDEELVKKFDAGNFTE